MKTLTRRHRRGTVLMTVLILLVIGSIVSIALCQYMFSMMRLEERRADGLKAFYIAESGINRVVDFFNHPDEYPDSSPDSGEALAMMSVPSPSFTMAGFGTISLKSEPTEIASAIGLSPMLLANAITEPTLAEDSRLFYYDKETGTFPNLETQLQNGNVTVDSEVYPEFNGQNGLFGTVEHIEFQPPANGDPANCFARMSSTGVTSSGVRKTVSVFLFSGNPAASSPAALISKKGAEFSGNVSVRWGEVWIKERGTMPNWSKWGNYIDPNDNMWTGVKTNDLFVFKGSGVSDSNKYMDGSKSGLNDPITNPANPRYIDPSMAPAELDAYAGRLLQHQDLDFPEFNYDSYKLLAQRRGDYYTTDANNKLYRRDGTLVADIYNELWRADPSSTDNRFVFVDTIDKQPPRADGSNLATFPLSGNSPHSRGLYYLNINLDASGMGNPPTMTVKDPNGSPVQLAKVWHAGIIYISGNLHGVGNSVVYGSVIAERGISEAGTPSVYYDKRLSDSTFMPLNSLVAVRLFEVR